MGKDITAASFLADLKRQGFILETDGKDIRIAPAERVTEALYQDIRRNKRELMALLLAGAPPAGQLPPPKQEQPAVVAAAPRPPKPEAAVPEPPPKPPLCARCRPVGHALCQECMLAADPGLVRGRDGCLYQLNFPGKPWQESPYLKGKRWELKEGRYLHVYDR
jgi:hypothetical protein